MENKSKVMIFIVAFITVIVGVVFLGSIADMVYENTHRYSIVNETIVITAGAGQTAKTDTISATYFGNNSKNTLKNTTIGFGDEINVSSAGVVKVKTGTSYFSTGSYHISYSYEPTNYVSDSTSRTIVALIVIFFAMAILIGTIAYFKGFLDFGF